MEIWAVALDIRYDNFTTNEHNKEKTIIIVKANNATEAMEKAKEKFLAGKPRSLYKVGFFDWNRVNLDDLD